MSHTVRCSICHELLDRDKNPRLNVGTWNVCLDCWEKIQDYLTARGFTILQVDPSRDWKAAYEAESEVISKVWEALGINTYEDAKPYSIWEHVARLKAQIHMCSICPTCGLPFAPGVNVSNCDHKPRRPDGSLRSSRA